MQNLPPFDFIQFPNPREIKQSLVATGGELTVDFLLSAYFQGIFPWFNAGEPVLWWSPDPRFVLLPQELHVPSRLGRFMKSEKFPFEYTMDADFSAVIENCAAAKRAGQEGTWITSEMKEAYKAMFRAGAAHSFEVWHKGQLAGGFYGVLLGTVFFGESMFTKEDNAAKCALVNFAGNFRSAGGRLIDSQVYTDNIARFGGRNISREAFLRMEEQFLFDTMDQDLRDFYPAFAPKV